VGVRVTVGDDGIRAARGVVAAFLPLRFKVENRTGRELMVVVVRGGEAVGRVAVPASATRPLDVDGQKAGTLEIQSPDLAPDVVARVRVEPGG
jgi:hypothetical protein